MVVVVVVDKIMLVAQAVPVVLEVAAEDQAEVWLLQTELLIQVAEVVVVETEDMKRQVPVVLELSLFVMQIQLQLHQTQQDLLT